MKIALHPWCLPLPQSRSPELADITCVERGALLPSHACPEMPPVSLRHAPLPGAPSTALLHATALRRRGLSSSVTAQVAYDGRDHPGATGDRTRGPARRGAAAAAGLRRTA